MRHPNCGRLALILLLAMIHQGEIDLDPGYQRGSTLLKTSIGSRLLILTIAEVVWPAAKQSQIIQSLFHHYYVPPIVFSIYEDPDTDTVIRKCVDGKQRLTSIQKFMDGQVRGRTSSQNDTLYTDTLVNIHRFPVCTYC